MERWISASWTDLLRATAGRMSARERPATVGEICTRPALTVPAQMTAVTASRRMLDHDVSRLGVEQEGRAVGLFTRADALRVLLRPDAELAAVVTAASCSSSSRGSASAWRRAARRSAGEPPRARVSGR